MIALVVVAAIVAALFLISRIRVGGRIQYSEEGFYFRLLVGPLKFTLFPRKKKSKEEQEKKEKKKERRESRKKRRKDRKKRRKGRKGKRNKGKTEGTQEEKKTKRGGALPPLMDLLPLVADVAGRLKRKIRIDRLILRLTWASSDPFRTAMEFGAANAAMNVIWPMIDNNFRVKEYDLSVDADFDRTSPDIFCDAVLTMTIGQILSLGVRIGVQFLKIWSRSRKDSGKKQEGTT